LSGWLCPSEKATPKIKAKLKAENEQGNSVSVTIKGYKNGCSLFPFKQTVAKGKISYTLNKVSYFKNL